MALIQIIANAVQARALTDDRDVKLLLSGMLSYEVEGAANTDLFKQKRWDGRQSFFDFRTGRFPAGFTHMVKRTLEKGGYQVQIATKPVPEPLGPPVGSDDPMGFGFSDRYDYQLETVRRLLRHKRMIARVATGGGKSRICILTFHAIRRPALFLTARKSLMHQMVGNFEAAGFTAGIVGDGIWRPRRGINCGMVQTLARRLEEKHPEREKTLAFLRYVEVLFGEEAHEISSAEYTAVVNACTNAHYRLALTATPFMKGDEEANMMLQASFGSIGIEITEELLIDRGILAEPFFKIVPTQKQPMLRMTTSWPACYEVGIVENNFRNNVLVEEAVRAARFGKNVLTLVSRQAHGHRLKELFQEAGLRSAFVFGEHKEHERKEALRDLQDRQLDVLCGSSIFDVGVDVPSIDQVYNAGAGKAEVGQRQKIGRGLREKKVGPNMCCFVDFADNHNKTLKEHARTRLAILQSTPGFAERILPLGADFPPSAFS